MKFAPLAALAAAAVCLAVPAGASAMATDLAPATATSVFPTFSWSLPSNEQASSFVESPFKKVDSYGNLIGGAGFEGNFGKTPTTTIFKTPSNRPLDMGTYWWQVGTYDPVADANFLTPPTKLVVPGIVQIAVHEKNSTNASDNLPEAEFEGYVRGNLPSMCLLQVKIMRGTKVLSRGDDREQGCNGWIKSQTFDNWQAPKVKKGTPLTATITVTWKKLHWTSPTVLHFRAP